MSLVMIVPGADPSRDRADRQPLDLTAIAGPSNDRRSRSRKILVEMIKRLQGPGPQADHSAARGGRCSDLGGRMTEHDGGGGVPR